MGADSCFRMGANHSICQDYAASGIRANGLPYALVSDGCSGSAFTDYGARFLVQAARLHLTTSHFFTNVPFLDSLEHGGLLSHARLMAQAAYLPSQCLDATLIRAMVVGDEIWVHHSGDGVITARKRDGSIEFVSIHFGENMPYYLSYRLNSAEEKKYIERVKIWSKTWGRRIGDPSKGTACWKSSTEADKPIVQHVLVGELCFGPEYDLVLIMTDGAESFQTLAGEPIGLPDVLDQLFDIKSYAGEFITRRCKGFLGKFCAEHGWKHSDDFAVAGIYRP